MNKNNELIQNQYNNTLVDHNKDKESMHEKTISTEFDENDAVVFVLDYFNYLQCRTTEVAECIARYHVSRKMMIAIVLAYLNYFQCQTTEVAECTARYNMLRKMMIVTVPTYLNFLQNQSTEDARTITRFYALRNTKDTKSVALTDRAEKETAKTKIDVTQAGSD